MRVSMSIYELDHSSVQNGIMGTAKIFLLCFILFLYLLLKVVRLRNKNHLLSSLSYRGLPVWLHLIPGTVFRTDNKSFKVCPSMTSEMAKFI